MRRPAPLPQSPDRADGARGGDGRSARATESGAGIDEVASATDAAVTADGGRSDAAGTGDTDAAVTAPVIPLADGLGTASDGDDPGANGARERAGGAALGAEADEAPVGLRDVWRATRARRRALRAEVRRFTARQRRRRMVWIGVGASLGVLVLGTLGAAYSPLFAVEDIRVVGASQLDPAEVSDALSDQLGTPLPLVDESAIKAALITFPLVETYSLEARPPHELVVRIVERTPVGSVESAAGYSLVDAAGVVLSTSAQPAGDVPIISVTGGTDSDAFVAVGQVMRSLPDDIAARVTEVSATSPDDVTLRLGETNTDVVWGSAEDSAEKALVLEKIMAARPPEGVFTYDVSSPNAVVVS